VSKNKYIIALKRTILFSAIIHLLILLWYAINTGNLKIINLFNILDLDLIYPNILKGNLSDFLSILALIIIYIVFLVI